MKQLSNVADLVSSRVSRAWSRLWASGTHRLCDQLSDLVIFRVRYRTMYRFWSRVAR